MQEGTFQCCWGSLYPILFIFQLLFITAHHVPISCIGTEDSEVTQIDQHEANIKVISLGRNAYHSYRPENLRYRNLLLIQGFNKHTIHISTIFLSDKPKVLLTFHILPVFSRVCVWGGGTAIFVSKCIEEEWVLGGRSGHFFCSFLFSS